MEFLRRHLPRVHQAVQNALDYLTNMTAQIFGAPPDAPQPRNTRAKTPLKSEEAAAAPEKQEEAREPQGADHMTLDVSLEDAALEATEESMKIYGIQQDAENRAQETEVRYRKEAVDRRVLDPLHTTSHGKNTLSHYQVTVESHKDQSHKTVTTNDSNLTKPEDIDYIPCSVIREVQHEEVHTVNNEEVRKVNQEATEVHHEDIQTVVNEEVRKVIQEAWEVHHKEVHTGINEEVFKVNQEARGVHHEEVHAVINEEVLKVGQEAMEVHYEEVHMAINEEAPKANQEATEVHHEDIQTVVSEEVRKVIQEAWEVHHEVRAVINKKMPKVNQEAGEVHHKEVHTGINEEVLKVNQEARGVHHEEVNAVINEEVLKVGQEAMEVHHEEVHMVINEEEPKVNQEALVYDEHTRFNTEEESYNLRLENLLQELEPKRYLEHKVPPTSNQVLKSNLNLETEENSCSTHKENISPIQNETIIIQEISQETSICYVTVTSEKCHQELPGDVPAPPVLVEYDDLDVPDIKRQHKVTPISETDRSPCDQGEEARKTWEHLQETAVRLAMHCDLLQNDNQECETLASGEMSNKSSVDEVPSSEEDTGLCKPEGNKYNEQNQKVEKMRRRVHFSLSTEERELMFRPTEVTDCIKNNLIEEGALEPTTEYWVHPLNIISRPEPNDIENNIGFISSNQDTEPSMMDQATEEDQVNPLHMGCTLWYDEPEGIITDEEMCGSIGDKICQSMTSGFEPEETVFGIHKKKPLKELSPDVPSIEKMQDSKEVATKNSVPSLVDIITHSGVDLDEEHHHGEGTWSFDKVDGSLEQSLGVVSDHLKPDESIFVENEETSVSLEVVGQSSEEIKVGLFQNEDMEHLKQQVHGADDSEDTKEDAKEEMLGLECRLAVDEMEESTKVGLTSRSDELNLQECVSRLQCEPEGQNVAYTRDKGVDEDQTAEVDNVETVGLDLTMMIETQKENLMGRDYEDLKECKHKSLQENVSVKETQEMDDYTWYRQDSYKRDGLITYSDSNEELGSHKDQNPTETVEELSEQLPYKDSESEVISKDGGEEDLEDLKAKDNQQEGSSEADSSKVNDLHIISETKEGICTDTGLTEQNISKEMGRSEVIHGAVSSGNTEMVSIEDNFAEALNQTDNIKDLYLQCMLMEGHRVDEITENLPEENQSPLDDTSSLGEDHIEVILDKNFKMDNISEPQDKDELLSELYSEMSVHLTAEVIETKSTRNVGQSMRTIDNVSISNSETITEKITVKEHECLEEYNPGLHLSEEFGFSREPKHTFKEEHYSSSGITVTETEVSDGGVDIKTTIEMSENKEEQDTQAGDDQFSADEPGAQYLTNATELEIALDTRSSPEEDSNEKFGSMSDLYAETVEEGGNFLSITDLSAEVNDIVSALNKDVSDKRLEDGQSNDEAIVDNLSETDVVEQQQHPEELGFIVELERTFDEHPFSTADITETQVEATDFNNDFKKIKIDLSPGIHCDLILGPTEEISVSKKVESQSFKILDDVSRRQFGDLKDDKPEISLESGSLVKDIDISFLSTSELSQGEGDLLSEIQPVVTTDHPTDVISLVSTSGKEDILDTNKACEGVDDSAVQVDLVPDNVIPDEQNDFSVITYSEELGSILGPSQELEEIQCNSLSLVSTEGSHVVLDIVSSSVVNVNELLDDQEQHTQRSEVQSMITTDFSVGVTTGTSTVKQDAVDEATGEDTVSKNMTMNEMEASEITQDLSPSQPSHKEENKIHEQDFLPAMLTTAPQVTVDVTGCNINEFSKTTEYFGSSDLEISHPPSMEHANQEVMEEQAEEQNKHVVTIHTEEPLKSLEPPSHMEISEDQDKPLGDHKETLKEPSVEDDAVDNSLLPHNTLDVSAQKSRVQLRRKISIRRKQGQRQVTPESEPMEPPQPAPRQRPMGIPIFPGKMPIFAMAPTMTPEVSHPAEEQKEEKPAEEELLVKPKKGIPRHAGFGIPHPQMMQELQARMKKKKQSE
ncbi:uro-adherence factor A-like [Dendropsophus ebraccatus]|uniref:uro-adherence factor A-like n=1 Tax=Dendropsophus ebraccatus TaxID=150705 RepID=UPI00383228B8